MEGRSDDTKHINTLNTKVSEVYTSLSEQLLSSHPSPGTTSLCSTPGSSNSYDIHLGHSKCKAWIQQQSHSDLPSLWAYTHIDPHSGALDFEAGTRYRRAPQGPGSARSTCLRQENRAPVNSLASEWCREPNMTLLTLIFPLKQNNCAGVTEDLPTHLVKTKPLKMVFGASTGVTTLRRVRKVLT